MGESFQKILAATDQAVAEGKLLESTAKNIRSFLTDGNELAAVSFRCDPGFESVRELVEKSAWSELNDRFYKTLAFGTGGLRGRTIGKVVPAAEQGEPQPLDRPQYPCVGTNAMNYYNVSRATQGLVLYVKEWAAGLGDGALPKLV